MGARALQANVAPVKAPACRATINQQRKKENITMARSMDSENRTVSRRAFVGRVGRSGAMLGGLGTLALAATQRAAGQETAGADQATRPPEWVARPQTSDGGEKKARIKVGLYSITYLGLWYRGKAIPLEE